MVNTYKLINPSIHGKFKTKIEARNSDEASNLFYTGLSEHFNNSVPEFYFTIQKGSGDSSKYSHYKVTEKRSKKNEVTYTITNHKIKNEELTMKEYLKRLNQFKQSAGKGKKKHSKKHRKSSHKRKSKRHDSDSDSSDSSDSDSDYSDFDDDTDILTLATKLSLNDPFHYWRYDPYLYGIKNLFPPSFLSTSVPWQVVFPLNIYPPLIEIKSS